MRQKECLDPLSALQWQLSSNVNGFNPWKMTELCDAGKEQDSKLASPGSV